MLSGKLKANSFGLLATFVYKDKAYRIMSRSRKHITAANWLEESRKHCRKDETPILHLTDYITQKSYIIMEADLFWNEILPRLEEA